MAVGDSCGVPPLGWAVSTQDPGAVRLVCKGHFAPGLGCCAVLAYQNHIELLTLTHPNDRHHASSGQPLQQLQRTSIQPVFTSVLHIAALPLPRLQSQVLQTAARDLLVLVAQSPLLPYPVLQLLCFSPPLQRFVAVQEVALPPHALGVCRGVPSRSPSAALAPCPSGQALALAATHDLLALLPLCPQLASSPAAQAALLLAVDQAGSAPPPPPDLQQPAVGGGGGGGGVQGLQQAGARGGTTLGLKVLLPSLLLGPPSGLLGGEGGGAGGHQGAGVAHPTCPPAARLLPPTPYPA
ncbi:hypothetical protein V8C86DRAFT_909091 [Haematococcus lacustris]